MLRWCSVVSITALALGAWSCSSSGVVKEAQADTVSRVTVPVARAAREDLSSGLELAAEFRLFLEVEVHAKVAGYLKNITVDIGDRVRTGQLLATLEVPELNDQLTEAAAGIERSQSEVARAEDDLRRAESEHAAMHASYTRLAEVVKGRPNLVAQQEIDDALAKDSASEAQVSAAQAALESARHQVQVSTAQQSRLQTLLAYSRITAPFQGVITKRYADPGAMIQAGTASQTQTMPVVQLSEADRLRLILPVPESVVPRVRLGAPVAVRVPALNRTFDGTVARFTGKLQESTRTMDTEVDVENSRLELMPGMYAYATLTLDRRPGVLAVPIQAVAGQDRGMPTVLVVNPRQQLEERSIKIGIQTPSKVEVVSGLAENDLVVIGSRSRFRAGQVVEPKVVAIPEVKEGS